MRDKLLRVLGPTGRTRGAANARSKISISPRSSPLGTFRVEERRSSERNVSSGEEKRMFLQAKQKLTINKPIPFKNCINSSLLG